MVFEHSSNGKKRVSFSVPNDNNEKPRNVRLKSPAAKPADKSISNNKQSYKQSFATRQNIEASVSRPSRNSIKQPFEIKSKVEASSSFPHTKSKVKKCFVRNVEVPIASTSEVLSRYGVRPQTRRAGILKNPLTSGCEPTLTEFEEACYKSKYATPELYSSLSVAKKIQSTLSDQKKQTVLLNVCDVDSITKHKIEEKASSRLNFPLEQQVYRDLIALNINDDELLGKVGETCGCTKDYESTRRKDQEPRLGDFYEPSFGDEYGSVCKPTTCNVEKVRRYNGLSVYNQAQMWENRN